MPKVNTLTTDMTARFGTIVLETLVKHYFDRLKRDHKSKKNPNLKQDEILYHEAFNVVKAFLEAASHHTVEEVQDFSNTPTPSPPWTHVIRVVVPRKCCDKAAEYLIRAMGGEEACRRTVGGTKWWQVRGIDGVDGQWITAKKDWDAYLRRTKEREKAQAASKQSTNDTKSSGEEDAGVSSSSSDSEYAQEMDDMRCILYAHGGGYYFGSVDQERYSIARHARKINGRVFAINYRLAPQYPFPCALQDLLASYLYLIDPPPSASHKPVNPAQIVVAGDSAGGGLTLALLQVLRDTPGVPLPAGGILISPWCDLTHSFPSVLTNTKTDVIPAHGLCMQKPSTLWPPPSEDMTSRVHTGLRSRLRRALNPGNDTYDPTDTIVGTESPTSSGPSPGEGILIPATTAFSPPSIELKTQNGDTLVIDTQVQMYTENALVGHPLVSSAASYLGGLPPLMFIASEGEVLRDEILYAAHRAAYPQRFPVSDAARNLYPSLKGIERRHPSPTKVHLQVYDDSAHVLPVLFLFTTPAKFCFRAMASFCKHIMTTSSADIPPLRSSLSLGAFVARSSSLNRRFSLNRASSTSSPARTPGSEDESGDMATRRPALPRRRSSMQSFRRSLSHLAHLKEGPRGKRHSLSIVPPTNNRGSAGGNGNLSNSEPTVESSEEALQLSPEPEESDVAGSRFEIPALPPQERFAGDPSVYESSPWTDDSPMIRERVSIQGLIRPLEPESELDAMKVPAEQICQLSEPAVRRYLDAKAKFEKKYQHVLTKIEKQRRQHIIQAKEDTIKQLSALRSSLILERNNNTEGPNQSDDTPSTNQASNEQVDNVEAEENDLCSQRNEIYFKNWSLAWALDDNERPPPSSIVARRDTGEARRLAMIADQSMFKSAHSMSANNLWTALVNLLSNPSDKAPPPPPPPQPLVSSPTAASSSVDSKDSEEPRKSKWSRFLPGKKRSFSRSRSKKESLSQPAE